jgi:hypothetical protein
MAADQMPPVMPARNLAMAVWIIHNYSLDFWVGQ